MMILVTGGSGSGKSAYAEELMKAWEGKKYYIATMQIYDEEGVHKVERHRRMREGKGFETIEKPCDIGTLFKKEKEQDAAALLECMSNLTANEMFCKNKIRSCDETADKIINEIRLLKERILCWVIVTNNVFEDGIQYDESTMEYLRAMGKINASISRMADRVIEVVAGIPVVIK